MWLDRREYGLRGVISKIRLGPGGSCTRRRENIQGRATVEEICRGESPRVEAATLGTDEDMLAAWPYGRALARTGDDNSPRAIREHAACHVFHGHIAYWLGRISDGSIEHWKDVTQKWPEPWYSWDGAIVRGIGKLRSATAEEVVVEYCIIKEPAKEPTAASSWHGVAWVTETALPLTLGDREQELILADGTRGSITVSTASFVRLLFVGRGPSRCQVGPERRRVPARALRKPDP